MSEPAPPPQPFTIQVPDAVLADLRQRLGRVRWPDEIPGAGWAYGTELAYMHDLVTYWREAYDWRTHEALLNGFTQYTVPLGGIDLHFIHEPGRGPHPLPLLISHGWPGSVWEFYKLIPLLTDPARFGGDSADAFTVIAPSLPGYGFSFRPHQQRFNVEAIADLFAQLMTEVLGYQQFAAQGGDWGAFITSRLGYAYADRLVGIHVNLLSVRRDLSAPEHPTNEERAYLEDLRRKYSGG
jgi:pimeloyl-ACP methyl ester carboxylesterase